MIVIVVSILLISCVIFYGLFIYLRIYAKLSMGVCRSPVCLVGKTAIITGGNQGIGYETALNLAARGCNVIIADRIDGKEAVSKIIKETDNPNISFKYIDLSNFQTIRTFVKEIKETIETLDILINNAGSYSLGTNLSNDGLRKGMQINYFGPFLLTFLLIELLRKSSSGRIVFVSSLLAFYHSLKIGKIHLPSSDWAEYCNSKLCIIAIAGMFAEKLDNYNIYSFSVHPGFVRTNLFDKLKSHVFIRSLLNFCLRYFAKSVRQGSQTVLHAALSRNILDSNGDFFVDCRKVAKPKLADDKSFCETLWNLSVELTKAEKKTVIIIK